MLSPADHTHIPMVDGQPAYSIVADSLAVRFLRALHPTNICSHDLSDEISINRADLSNFHICQADGPHHLPAVVCRFIAS